jgi:spore maturation protein CgeB
MAQAPVMRVLVCGDFANATQPLSRQCAQAFAELGLEVLCVDTEVRRRKLPETAKRWSKSIAKLGGRKAQLSSYYEKRERAERNENVRRAFREQQPDLVLVVRGNDLEPDLLSEMRAAGALTACWWIKGADRLERMIEERPSYDLYYCVHRNRSVDGIRYLPAYALDSARYSVAQEPTYLRDVGFVGIWKPKRQEYLEPLVDLKLGIVGPGWRTRSLLTSRRLIPHVAAARLQGAALAAFYQSSRIVVNINQWQSNEASGTTLRVADVPACGAFLLSEYSAGLEEIFALGREVVAFSSREELEDKTRYYLAHDAEREAIARAGYERALRLPRHAERMSTILEDSRALRGARRSA